MPEFRVNLPTFHPGQLAAYLTGMDGRYLALCCGRRWGKCLAMGTRIAMADGSYKDIKNVVVGDLIWTVNETTGKLEYKPVNTILSNGIKETVNIKTNAHSTISTPNHPFLVNGVWIEAKDIKSGDLIATPLKMEAINTFDIEDYKIDFLAMWLADGKKYNFYKSDKILIDIFKICIENFGLKLQNRGVEGLDWFFTHDYKIGEKNRKRNPAADYLKSLGLWDCNSKSKFIPDFVYRLSNQKLARFLNLFLSCDGCITKKAKSTWSLEIGLANYYMVKQVQELLLRFGIRGQIYLKSKTAISGSKKRYEAYDFISCDSESIINYCKLIGSVNKQDKINQALNDAQTNSENVNKSLPISYEEIDQLITKPRSKEILYDLRAWRKNNKSKISRYKFNKLRPYIDDRFDWMKYGDITWEEVKSISSFLEIETFDLSIKDNHNFIADGLICHNTDFMKVIATDAVIKGQNVGIFTPNYKIQAEIYTELLDLISPIHKSASRMEGVIRTVTDGRIDFWSLENERAGRSRKYHVALIDEAAFTKPNMLHVWETAIKPALFDYGGKCFAASTPNGNKKTNFFYAICNDPKYEFVKYHAPTHQNPLIPARNPDESDADYLARRQAEFDNLKATNEARVYRQEFLAEFVDWSGDAFFDEQNFLYLGQPVDLPRQCDSVFAVIDTAVKTGKEHDGTAVSYFAIDKIGQFKLIVADWEILQIQGSMLEVWVPSVFRRCEELAAQCKARFGSLGVFIEDKYSGSVLIQQIQKRTPKVHAIDSKLTALGKDERAINISTYIHRQMVKISREAYEKQVVFKGIMSNHWLDQVCGFHLDEPDQADDLLDTLCYGATIALGGRNGF